MTVEKLPSKPVQVSCTDLNTYLRVVAVCEDGSIWQKREGRDWECFNEGGYEVESQQEEPHPVSCVHRLSGHGICPDCEDKVQDTLRSGEIKLVEIRGDQPTEVLQVLDETSGELKD